MLIILNKNLHQNKNSDLKRQYTVIRLRKTFEAFYQRTYGKNSASVYLTFVDYTNKRLKMENFGSI